MERALKTQDRKQAKGERGEEDHLGHGNCREIEHVRIERETSHHDQRSGGIVVDLPRALKKAEASYDETQGRRNATGETVAPQPVGLYERETQHVEQRQPDGAELIVAGCEGIEQAAADIEMRFSVAVIKSPTVSEATGDGSGHQESERAGNRRLEPIKMP